MQGGDVLTPKPDPSPFIPGPSRQILEGLMKENSYLKKIIGDLTGKVKIIVTLYNHRTSLEFG